jgi:phosphoribosylamine--glycine ligase
MNVLLIGGGGREHALAWKLAQSPLLNRLYIAPGNAGTLDYGENVNLSPLDFPALESFALANAIEMIVVGPEDPLVNGIVDYFANSKTGNTIKVIGPNRIAAQLEGSKAFSKEFMRRNRIPTARYSNFSASSIAEGKAFLRTLQPPYVLKASGLAAGKGVVILSTLSDAEKELEAMVSGKFGDAGSTVVIEEFLSGIECSVFALCDGSNYLILPEAKDYKRIGDGDTGPNTGGMGAVSPVPFCTPDFLGRVENEIIKPTLDGLIKEGILYTGFLFFGIMNVDGNPFVIEYNCRLGDPETEVVIPRIKNDLIELLNAVSTGTLGKEQISINKRTAATVFCVAGGYPENYKKGNIISGLEKLSDELVFHAGTTLKDDQVVSNGGRVLAVTSLSDNLRSALKNNYDCLEILNFEGMFYRKDIGQDLLQETKNTSY